MVETGRSFRYNDVNKRYEVIRECGVDAESKKLRDGRNGRKNHHERERVIDPDYQSFVLHRLREAERNDLRRNKTAKKRLLKKGFVETNQDDVLPRVPEYEVINDRGKRQRVNVVNVDDEDGYGSDADPELQNVLNCLKEYGNAYAFEGEDNSLIIYEEKCSSDDLSKPNSPREMRMDCGQQTNVNSIDENPRVGLAVESVTRGIKGILRKRKNDGPACIGTVDLAAVQVNSREVLNQKRIEFESKKEYFEKKSKTLLKEKNVVRKVVEEENYDDEEEEAYDDVDDVEEDGDGDDEEDSNSDDDDYDCDDSVAEDDSDYDDAYDYDDDCDDDYNYRLDVDKEYSLERNLRRKSKEKNKKYLNRRCSPIYNLVMEDERPSIGKSSKMDKGKNVVSEVTEAKTKPKKWFKQDNMGSIGPSRPHKPKIAQSGKQLKEKVKKEKILKIAVEERDANYDEIEILDRPEVNKGNCFVTDRNDADDSNGCADYRRRVLCVLNEPYDPDEYRRLFEEVNVYFKTFPDLKRKLSKYRYWPGKRLPILRGFFYWLQKSPHDGVFKPWKDRECLSVNLHTSNV